MTRHVWNNQSIIDNILELHCYCHTICKGNQTNGDTSVFVKFHVQVVYCSCPWICRYFLRVANWTVQQNLKKIYKKLKQCQIICNILNLCFNSLRATFWSFSASTWYVWTFSLPVCWIMYGYYWEKFHVNHHRVLRDLSIDPIPYTDPILTLSTTISPPCRRSCKDFS